jgi:hypothetical protein
MQILSLVDFALLMPGTLDASFAAYGRVKPMTSRIDSACSSPNLELRVFRTFMKLTFTYSAMPYHSYNGRKYGN